jgi:hypothetical protein
LTWSGEGVASSIGKPLDDSGHLISSCSIPRHVVVLWLLVCALSWHGNEERSAGGRY